jgi:outer membrane assembly lipoprotein YfiO
MWRKPELDPTYGDQALAAYNTLIGLYPNSKLIPEAQKDIADVENWFAIKDYDAGMYYFRRKAYDSAILYFKDALAKYATTPQAHDVSVRLVQAYKSIRYREDASELCAQLRERYQGDRDVRGACNGVAPPTAAPDSVPSPPAKPPAS